MMKFPVFFLLLALSLQTACANRATQSGQDMAVNESELPPLQAIIVLPTTHDFMEQQNSSAEAGSLDEGARVMNAILAEYFATSDNIIIISPRQAESLTGTFIGNVNKNARHVAEMAGGDAVLITQLIKYQKLDGKKYGANEPASVSFDYRLIHLESGTTLCKGSYIETQKTLFSNIFSFDKASKRKFEFVSAEALLREGIRDKFAACSVLAVH